MKFAERLKAFFGIGRSDAELFDDLADLLVEGDLGASLAYAVGDELKAACHRKRISDPASIKLELKDILMKYGRETSIVPAEDSINVFLLVGVNGVGKTTSCAKLAERFRSSGYKGRIILAAGDTFRAAAIDQLKIHGDRLGIRVVAQQPGSDPGAVLWDAIEAVKADGRGLVIADTAGRMHTRQDLLRELEKIDRIIDSRAPGAHRVRLLVIDATTGQNGLRQAEIFSQAVPVDGIILTKYDSSAKGGMAIALARELGLPTAFLGTGEQYRDFVPFSLSAFLDDFLGTGR
jgi:fused signal recognition particle receptor